MTDSEFELILDNWVRWSRTRYRIRRSQSLEGHYRSPQPWDKPPTSRGPIDKLAGEEVEQAWAALAYFPHKMLLKWHYIFLRPVWGIVKSLRTHGYNLHPMDYDREVQRAVGALRNALDMAKNSAEDSRHNSATALRSLALMAGVGVAEAIARAA